MKVKKSLLPVLLFGLVLSLCFTTFHSAGVVKADELNETQVQLSIRAREQIYTDLYDAFPQYIGTNRTVGSIKQLHDFDGNSYYAVEFVPSGFAIYDSTFTVALEINAVAESPYFGLSKNLMYAGPTYYYVKPDLQPRSGDFFVHTVIDNSMVVEDDEMTLLIEKSKALNSRINNYAEELATKRNSVRSSAEARVSTTWQIAELSNRSRITSLSTTNFNTSGNCGYVAGAIIVYYQSQEWGSPRLAPNGWNMQLVADIQNGRAGGATESNVRWAISDYIKRCGTKDSIIDFIFPAASTIYNLVTENRPVIIGAMNIPDPRNGGNIAHMVVVHKVERIATKGWFGLMSYSNYRLWVHYGWNTTYNNHMISYSAISIDGRVNFN